MTQKLFDLIDAAQVTTVCRDLVRFNTVNPPGDERAAAEYVLDYLRPLGFEGSLVIHDEKRATACATLPGNGEVPAVVFNGHLDVVPVGAEKWLHEPFEGEIVDGQVWGRGSSDMKGGLAAMLVAAKALVTAGVPRRGDLIVTATAGEEVNMMGARALCDLPDRKPWQAVIISEPTYNRLGLAERGVFWPEFTTYGKTAHGSTPELGRNAIMMMVTLLTELDKLDIPYTVHPVLGPFTRSIDTIRGGVKTNVVPDSCVVTVDMRTLPTQSHQAIQEQLEAFVADLEKRIPDFKASVKILYDLPPAETSADVPAVQQFAQAVTEATGQPVQHEIVRFATEAAVFVPRLGVPGIIFGPGDGRLAHQPNEYVEIDKMVEAAKVYALATAQMLG